LMRKGRKRC